MTKWENDYINERQEQERQRINFEEEKKERERISCGIFYSQNKSNNQCNINSSGNGSPVFYGSNAGKNVVLNITTTTETFQIPEDKYYLPSPEEECKSCGAFDYEEKGPGGYFCRYCGKQYIFKKEINK